MKKTIFTFFFIFLSILLWFYTPLPFENVIMEQDKNIQPILLLILWYMQITVFLSMAQLIFDLNN